MITKSILDRFHLVLLPDAVVGDGLIAGLHFPRRTSVVEVVDENVVVATSVVEPG